MIGQFDFSQKGWVSGKGRSAVWRDIPWERKQIEPQYLMAEEDYRQGVADPSASKLAHMSVTSGTNTRTAIGSLIWGMPAGHKAPVLSVPSLAQCLRLASIFNTLTFDSVSRIRVAGLMLDYHVLEQHPVPLPSPQLAALIPVGTSLMLTSPRDAPSLLLLRARPSPHQTSPALANWAPATAETRASALSPSERVRGRAIADALVASLYGLDEPDFQSLLADSDHPLSTVTSRKSSELRGKGFWRVDKDKPPELRHTVLAQIAFADLQRNIDSAAGDLETGIQSFIAQNHGEGWHVPETLRLADYNLGHDDRAQRAQPVATALGPRFYDWQLAQPPEEAWVETHLHARNLLGEHGYRRLLADVEQRRRQRSPDTAHQPLSEVAEKHGRLDAWLEPEDRTDEITKSQSPANTDQPDLFS